MKKVNVAELLKDCPTGMELDSTMFEKVTFVRVQMDRQFPIEIAVNGIRSKYLTKEGCFHDNTLLPEAKCVIFPKGKTTWEGFIPPYEFKNGDIIVKNNFIAIISHIEPSGRIWYHCWYNTKYEDYKIKTDFGIGCINDDDKICFATREEKEKLFKVIKDNGYNWNEKTNTLEKLIKPIFKKGDKVRVKNGVSEPRIIDDVCDRFYTLVPIGSIHFTDQHNWELVPDKFDITTLKPFESRVLARYCKDSKWIPTFWGSYDKEDPEYPYNCCGMLFAQCIPYEGNEHLLGKTEECKDFYKTW